ncbi:MAG: extracellular solute-binding protein [Ilumatobacteraceae bacterium]
MRSVGMPTVMASRWTALVAAFSLAVGCAGAEGDDARPGDDVAARPRATMPSVPLTAPPPESTVLGESSAPAATSTAVRCVAPDDGLRTVVLWHALSPDAQEPLDAVVSAYNDRQDEVELVAVKQPNYELLLRELRAVPEADLPDVIIGNEITVRTLHDSGITVPPGECSGRGEAFPDLLPVVEATYTVDDELVAVPYTVSTPVLIYNATTVAAAGLDPGRPPTTPEELRSAADAVVASGAAPFGFVVHDQVGSWLLRQWAAQRGDLVVVPDNGRGETEKLQAQFLTDDTRQDFQWLRDGVADGSFVWIGGIPSGFDDLLRLVDHPEKAAFTMHTSAAVGGLLAIESLGVYPGQELGVSPLPGPAPGGLVGGGALWLIDRGDPTQVGAAWEAVQWLIEPSNLAPLITTTGYAPPSSSVAADSTIVAAWAAKPELRVGYDQLAAMESGDAAAGVLAGPMPALEPMMANVTDRIVYGEDVATVLRETENRFDALLADYARTQG